MEWRRQQQKPGLINHERKMPLAVGITHAPGRRETHNCCPGLRACFRRLATVAQRVHHSSARPAHPCAIILRNADKCVKTVKKQPAGAVVAMRRIVAPSPEHPVTTPVWVSEALSGIMLLRARTAAPCSRRIRAGLRLARLSGARVFTEDGSGKGSRPATSCVMGLRADRRQQIKQLTY